MKKKSFFTATNIAVTAVLLALVVVLQLWGSGVKIGGTSLSFVLVPIVLGAILIGPFAGAFLGFAFGLVVLLVGIFGMDPFTNVLFTDHPVLTSVLCLGKGTAAGLVPGLLFKAIKGKNGSIAVLVAAVSAPIINTGLFVLGALLMTDTIGGMAASQNVSAVYFIFIGCAGLNFIAEFIINFVAAPAIFTVVRVIGKSVQGKFFEGHSHSKTNDRKDESIANTTQKTAESYGEGNQ